MTWLTILKLLLTVADKIGDIIRANQLMNAGEAVEVGRQLANIAHSAGVAKEASDAIDAMTEPQVQNEVEADAR